METADKTKSPWGGFTVLDLLTNESLGFVWIQYHAPVIAPLLVYGQQQQVNLLACEQLPAVRSPRVLIKRARAETESAIVEEQYGLIQSRARVHIPVACYEAGVRTASGKLKRCILGVNGFGQRL